MTGIERELAARPEAAPLPGESIAVEIYDQVYHLRGTDAPYIEHLARLVDHKMTAVSSQGGTVDSLRVAVLAALNIADELETLRERYRTLASATTQTQSTMRTRSASLAGMLDEVLNERTGDRYTEPVERIRRAG